MTTPWSRRIPFRVDIGGIIDIMGRSLYSRPDTPIRELIQNAHDAIMRRRSVDLRHQGKIEIEQSAGLGTLAFHDDGIGLTAEEAEAYLGTLGLGITGMIKRWPAEGPEAAGDSAALIGQFGVGLFSAFLLADKIIVETRSLSGTEGVRWEAGPGSDIELSWSPRERVGTTVTLVLKPGFRQYAESRDVVEAAVREFADFLPVPIHLGGDKTRINVINVPWFDPTPDPEALELELESYFRETPLDIIPIRQERPATIAGALYVSPQRTPGFSSEATVAVTIRRMVISRKISGLLPTWASFLRGVLELSSCAPTASREDLVRDAAFHAVRGALEEAIYSHLERLASQEPRRLQSLLTWHRYTFAGAALSQPRLRRLLRDAYRFSTSQGALTFQEIVDRSAADPLFESEADAVLWHNVDRRQEPWVNQLFSHHPAPCVQALLSFEETLLATMIADEAERGRDVDLRIASPTSTGFAEQVLGLRETEDAPQAWSDFLAETGARILIAEFDPSRPVMAFLNERRELLATISELKKEGSIPAGFQRLIDRHYEEQAPPRNEVVLNRAHRLVARALSQSTRTPIASVLRLLVIQSLQQAGAGVSKDARQLQADDLDWVADALWGRESS
jgi:molecular chaperone HtpG